MRGEVQGVFRGTVSTITIAVLSFAVVAGCSRDTAKSGIGLPDTATSSSDTTSTSTWTLGVTQLSAQSGGLTIPQSYMSEALATGSPPKNDAIFMTNLGMLAVSYKASSSTVGATGVPSCNTTWLSIQSGNASGTVAGNGGYGTIGFTVDPTGLSNTNCTGTITVTAAGQSQTMQIIMSVSASTTLLQLSFTGLTYTAASGPNALSPASQSIDVLNEGSGDMSWTASVSTLSGGAWLDIDATSGVATGGPNGMGSTIDLSIDQTVLRTLQPGNYYGTLTVQSPQSGDVQLATIVINVLPNDQSPPPVPNPSGFTLVNSQTQTLTISNPGTGDITFSASPNTNGTGNWLSVSPTSGTIPSGKSLVMTLQSNTNGLAANTYPATVNIPFTSTVPIQFNESSMTLSVSLIVTSGGSSSSSGGGSSSSSSGSPVQPTPTPTPTPTSTPTPKPTVTPTPTPTPTPTLTPSPRPTMTPTPTPTVTPSPTPTPTKTPTPPPTVTFTASPLTAPVGTTVYYNWNTSGATSVSSTIQAITQNGVPVTSDACGQHPGAPWVVSSLNGSTSGVVQPCQSDYAYTLTVTATGAGGVKSASEIVTVPLAQVQPVPGLSFTASPLTAPAGTLVTYIWNTSNTTTVTSTITSITYNGVPETSDPCGAKVGQPWAVSTLGGTITATTATCQNGYAYGLTVYATGPGGSAQITQTVTVPVQGGPPDR